MTVSNQVARQPFDKRIALPLCLELETQSTCNRTCTTCLRNSHPDRAAVQDWFELKQMPMEMIVQAFEEATAMGFRGMLSLSHFNEPLQDPRLVEIVKLSKAYPFSMTVIHTNADFLTEEMARELDGPLTGMTVALYYDEPQKSPRAAWIQSLFKKTIVNLTGGVHMVSHFSPRPDLPQLIMGSQHNPCFEPTRRLILNHRGEMLLCCDDMIGHFDLGVFGPGTSLEQLWFSEKHQEMVLNLRQANSRQQYPHCASCPRVEVGPEHAVRDVHNSPSRHSREGGNP